MDQEQIGKFILNLRKQNNLTQKEFADKLHVTAQAVSKWENGRGIPDIEILQKMSKEFNVDIDSILTGKKEKKKLSKWHIITLIFLGVVLCFSIYVFLSPKDYNFSDVKSVSTKFDVSGVAAYSKDKNSIYISKIEYLDGEEDKKYIGMECILYESHNDLEEKVSQCGSLKEEKQTPKTLSELLTETEFKVESFSCTNRNMKNSNLYISINLLDTDNKLTTYKVPLKLTGTCN